MGDLFNSSVVFRSGTIWIYEPGSLGNGFTPGGSLFLADVTRRARPSNSSRDTAQTNLDWDTSANSSGVNPDTSRKAEAFPEPEGKSICSWAGWIDCDMVERW